MHESTHATITANLLLQLQPVEHPLFLFACRRVSALVLEVKPLSGDDLGGLYGEGMAEDGRIRILEVNFLH